MRLEEEHVNADIPAEGEVYIAQGSRYSKLYLFYSLISFSVFLWIAPVINLTSKLLPSNIEKFVLSIEMNNYNDVWVVCLMNYFFLR